jgi:hypothetical protein
MDLAAATNDRGARPIDTIPGVGAYTALFLSSVIDDVNRFPDSKHHAHILALSLHCINLGTSPTQVT